jgi:hypothetical protein
MSPLDRELAHLFEQAKKMSLQGFSNSQRIGDLKQRQHIKLTLQKLINDIALERTQLITKLNDATKAEKVTKKKYKYLRHPDGCYDPALAVNEKQVKVLTALVVAITELEESFKRLFEGLIGERALEFLPPSTTQSSLVDNVTAARERLIKKRKR